MRDIKFRGYHPEAKDMVYFGLGEDHISCASMDGENYNFHIEDGHPVMQYTGLTDSYGVEIYEGDIVKDYKDRVDVVRFHLDLMSHGCCGYAFAAFTPEVNDGVDLALCAVIGNIHENPELLEPVKA